MRKCWLCLLIMLCMSWAGQALAADMQILLDGRLLPGGAEPEIKNGVTFVPLRVISEQLGAEVRWSDNTVTINNHMFYPKKRQQKFSNGAEALWQEGGFYLTPGKQTAKIYYNGSINGATPAAEPYDNREEITLLAAPYLKNGQVMVPLRFIAERMGCEVAYENGRIKIELAGVAEFNGQKAVGLQIISESRNEVVKQKDIIGKCAMLIADCCGEEIEPPQNVAVLDYQGYQYQFKNIDNQTVAAWQFFVPAAEVEKIEDWSALYLYESQQQKWFAADKEVYAEYFYGSPNLEPYLNSVNVVLP